MRSAVGFLLALSLSSLSLFGQTTISTGSIQGSVTDPSGAVVPGAKISISNKPLDACPNRLLFGCSPAVPFAGFRRVCSGLAAGDRVLDEAELLIGGNNSSD
jgi:hypothetical protein